MATYVGNSPEDILKTRRRNYYYTATSSQTTFTGADDNGTVLNVNESDLEVFMNGVLLDQSDYTANTTHIVLSTAAATDDILEIQTFNDYFVDSNLSRFGGNISGSIIPTANNTYTLGNTTNRFADLYLSGTTLHLGDQTITSNATHVSMSGEQNVASTVTAQGLNISNQFYVNSDRAQHQTRITAPLITGLASDGYISIFGDASASDGLYVKDDGNVGIGTSSPAHLLDLLNSGSGDATIQVKSTTAGDPTLLFDSAAANRNAVIKFMDQGSFAGGRIQYVHLDDRMDFQSGSSIGATMSIKNNSVGIGTSSPATSLHIQSSGQDANVRVQAADNGYATRLQLYANNVSGASYNAIQSYINGDSTVQWEISGPKASAEDQMLFHTGGSEAMRISSVGHVGIGTTNPVYTLTVSEDGNDNIEIGAGIIQRYNRGSASYGNLTYYGAAHNIISLSNDIKLESRSSDTSLNSGVTAKIELDTVGTGYGQIKMSTGGGGGGMNTDALVVSPTGSIGIGTSSPINKLHIRNTTHSSTITGNATAGSIKFHSQSGSYTNGDYYGGIVWARPNSNGGTPTTFIASKITNSGSAADLVFGADTATVVTERMRIDNSGRVTMPFQPSFEVSVPQTWTTTATNTYAVTQWGTTHHNTGNHFSTSNGRFTAPVDGVYQFHGIMMGVNSSSPHLAFGINNSSQGGGLSYVNNEMWVHPNNSDNLIQIYHIIKLSAGDYVRLYTYSYNSVSASARCYFGGHFLG